MKVLKTCIKFKGEIYQLRIVIEAPRPEDNDILTFMENKLIDRGLIQ